MSAVTRTFLTGLLTAVSVGLIVPYVHGDGINGSGRAIDRFHSIVIDGVHYETDTALVRINGIPAQESDLRVGNRVIIGGDMTALEAWTVDYFETLAGTLTGISINDEVLQRAELVVMGVPVVTDADTWFHGAELADLQTGMQVAVSGSWGEDGSVLASSVHAKAHSHDVVTGFIGAFTAGGFTIGGVRIDTLYAQSDLSQVGQVVGLQVHVTGEFDDNGTLQADQVKVVSVPDVGDESVEVDGLISTGDAGLAIEGHPLLIDGDTVYLGGTVDDLVPGVKVFVKGTLSAAGALRAVEMEFERSATSRVDGRIEWVGEDAGFITVNGVRIEIDATITMRDDRDADHWFSPESLSHGDVVSVMVEEDGGALRAKRITRTHQSRRLLRIHAQGASFWSGLRAGNRSFREFLDADAYVLDGRPVGLWEMFWKLKRGDRVELQWDDDGDLERVEVSTRAKHGKEVRPIRSDHRWDLDDDEQNESTDSEEDDSPDTEDDE